MAVIRWNPGSDLMNLHSEMDRLFTELTEGLTPARMMRGAAGGETQAFLPLDIERTDRGLVIRASVPGFTPDEVNVTVDQGVLTIDAQHREEHEDKDKERNFLRRERFEGRLHRQILLGPDVNSEGAQASFENGVLTVTVPLAQRPQPRRIPVQPGSETTGQGGNGSARRQEAVGAGQQGS